MSTWQSAYIESNGIKLHFTRTGGGKPPFILAHGFSDDGLCWTPVVMTYKRSKNPYLHAVVIELLVRGLAFMGFAKRNSESFYF